MAYRFLRLGMTPDRNGPNDDFTTSHGSVFKAATPIPNGTTEDPNDYSNLDVVAESDPIYVGDMDAATVFVYSDTTSTSTVRVKGGPTPTGPWTFLDSGAIVNAALATPTVVNVFPGIRPEYVVIDTTAWTAGNVRALLVGSGY